MSLLAPAMLLGLLALGLPVLAHLLGRELPRRIPLATLRFLRPAEPLVTRRARIHDPWLLLARLLLLAALVFALARPVTTAPGGLAVVAEPHDAVVLLDGSRSMALVSEGGGELGRAVERVRDLVEALPPGSKVGLVVSDPDGPQIEVDEADAAHADRIEEALQAWLEDGAPRAGGWILGEALGSATALLGPSRGERERVVYAIGDRTARGLGSLPASAEGGVRVIPLAATGELDEPAPPVPEHVSIDAIRWQSAPDLDARAVRIEADLTRHGGEPDTTREVPVVLRIGESEVARARIDLTADGSAAVEFTHTLLDAEPVVAATVALLDADDDPLPDDDARHVWLAAQDALDVTIVNGDPSELRAHDEVFFAATAINAFERAQPIRLRSLAPDQLDARLREQGAAALEDVDVLVLGNLRAPAEDVAPAIVERVDRGMGLWITVGDRVEASEYNDRFGALLPLLMRGPSFAGTLPGRQEARTESLAPIQLSHPMFAGLRGDLGLAAARTRRLMLLEPDPARGSEIAVAFSSGAPALITRTYGQGSVAMMTTSVDADWTDLPLRPGFVPLVQRTLDYLGGTRASRAGVSLTVGEPRELHGDRPLTVHTPSGDQVPVRPDAQGLAVFADTWVPGHYWAHLTGSDDTSERPVFAVGVQPEESDTRAIETAARGLEEGTAEVVVHEPRWRALVWLALLVLAAESLLRLRWRRARA